MNAPMHSPARKITAAICAVFCFAGTSSVSGVIGTHEGTGTVQIVSFEASAGPRPAPVLQRSAPATWSSRSNVRWEARWGGEARYMV